MPHLESAISDGPPAKVGLQFDLNKIKTESIATMMEIIRRKWSGGRVYEMGIPNTVTYWFSVPYGRVVEFERECVLPGGACRIYRK